MTRQSVLEGLVLTVLAPDLRAVRTPTDRLTAALRSLATGGDPVLTAARAAFAPALLAWQRIYPFRVGPAVESNALFRSTYWPPRQASVERVLASDETIDDALIERLGVDAKGLSALELLLFGRPEAAGDGFFQGARAARDGAFAAAVGQDVQQRADAALRLLGDARGFAQRFSTGEPDGVYQLVNLMVETAETIASDRLGYVFALHEQGRLKIGAAPGGLCGVSADIVRNWLLVMQRIYLGAKGDGLCVLVQRVAAQTDQRVRGALEQALRDVSVLGPSLEQSAQRDASKLATARVSARALEVLLKTELASALGVSISIVSGDGD